MPFYLGLGLTHQNTPEQQANKTPAFADVITPTVISQLVHLISRSCMIMNFLYPEKPVWVDFVFPLTDFPFCDMVESDVCFVPLRLNLKCSEPGKNQVILLCPDK